MIQIVLINGEKQTGKSTFANALADLLFENGIRAKPYSMVAPLEKMVRNFLYSESDGPVTYEVMKKATAIPGLPFNGRDLMITFGSAMRNLHPYALNQIFWNQVLADREIDIWIIENWGFPTEYEFFFDVAAQGSTEEGIQVHTIHLDERATRQYEPREQFDHDNRFCLRDLCDMVNPAVNVVAGIIDPLHQYNVDTILTQFKPEEAMLKLKTSLPEALGAMDSSIDEQWELDGTPSVHYLRGEIGDPALSLTDVQFACLKFGFPNREQLRKWNTEQEQVVVSDEAVDATQGQPQEPAPEETAKK